MLEHGGNNRESEIEDRRTPDDIKFENLTYGKPTDAEKLWMKSYAATVLKDRQEDVDKWMEEKFPNASKAIKEWIENELKERAKKTKKK